MATIRPDTPIAYRNAQKRPGIPPVPTRGRRLLHLSLVIASGVLVTNALIGDRGLIDALDAHNEHTALQFEIDQLQLQNKTLRLFAQRLREDASAIEEIARRDLGLIRPGELLFLLADTPSILRERQNDRVDPIGNAVLISRANVTTRGGAVW